jgi:hypothetical protein
MNETIVTLILIAICASAVWLFYWVVTRRGNSECAGNSGGDPHSLSADSREAITVRTDH